MKKVFFLSLVWGITLISVAKPFTVVIDAGHGGKDPGALGKLTNEKSVNLSIALKLGKAIEERCKDVQVIYTRKTDRFVDLNERAEIANRNKADLFISIHTNALKTKAVAGAETYTLGLARTDENLQVAMRENAAILLEEDYIQKYEGFNPNSSESYIIFEMMQNVHMEQSLFFASEVQRHFKKAGRTDRGVRQAGFLVLRKTSMPSVLVETGYISNREEERYMTSAAGQNRLVQALCEAFVRFKQNFDKKNVSSSIATATVPTGKEAKKEMQTEKQGDKGKKIEAKGQTYKVQICASDKLLKENSPVLKGYPLSYYKEKELYKYTVGGTDNWKEIQATLEKVKKDFPSAFIVVFEGEARVR
ncbi:MAG: N-acetylmuramoyl-L-alanine amidase [Tannerellaceae bacterium]|jgi:N-acetylmuramoyl-L-alanine amidase|nr:N-acetylmuramoyl-L-alanine amidase [Tannerellaceae bacterium]